MKASRGDGIIDIASNHSVDETVEKLKGILQAKGITLFALVDHSGEAAKAGMKMRPKKFGSPTTAQVICRSDTTSRPTYCQTSRSSNDWRRRRRNKENTMNRRTF